MKLILSIIIFFLPLSILTFGLAYYNFLVGEGFQIIGCSSDVACAISSIGILFGIGGALAFYLIEID